MAILEKDEVVVLANLLESTGRCASSERNMLLGELGLDANYFQNDIFQHNPRGFCYTLVSQLSKNEDKEALLQIVFMIQQANTLADDVTLRSIQSKIREQRVYIIASAKGGVGKTLSGLAVASLYNNGTLQRSLLTIDTNTTNPDLSRILSGFKREDDPLTLEHASAWQWASVSDKLQLVWRDDQYLIKGGANSFWSGLVEVIDFEPYKNSNFDILVDTNLHVPNLVRQRQDLLKLPTDILRQLPLDLSEELEQLIRKVIEAPGRVIYIWIFWTWASLHEMELISNDLNTLKRMGQGKINFVHVLNPSALMLPNIGTPPTRTQYREKIERWQTDMMELEASSLFSDDFERKTRIIQNIEENINYAWETIDKLPRHIPYAVPGMANLKLEPTVRPINFGDFEHTIAKEYVELTNTNSSTQEVFMELYDKIVKRWNGRPSNIFPISTHDPQLVGYTDMFARNAPDSFEKLTYQLESIVADMEHYLPGLSVHRM